MNSTPDNKSGPAKPIAVVAFGGNALLRAEDRGTQEEQIARAKQAARWLAEIIRHEYKLVIVHGNGPQVGNILIQSEEASTKVPPQTLDVAVAQTEGSIGFLLQQAMRNRLETLNLPGDVATILTEVEVDPNDTAFKKPTKPIGPFFTRYRAETLSRDYGWTVREDSGRGWRKVVPSPRPLRILNLRAIRALIESGDCVVAAGGGGIPVIKGRDGQWRGIEAVIDKDHASALLAAELKAALYIVLTAVPKVAVDFGKPTERWLDEMTVEEAEQHLEDGQFPPGSMGPKIEAAIDFVRRSGQEVLICDVDHLREALDRKAGTRITP
ncbi:MAG TPA: carbamate kinase [Thermoanaerobaculia bacterium]|nr:carbamate kinase [Thermoanaerobaculia bacterium]